MAKRFEGQIAHDEESIKRLFRAAYSVYDVKKMIFRFALGAVLIVIGVLGNFPMAVKTVLMMAGCWYLASGDFPARCRADRTLEQRKTALPVIRTTFYDDHIALDGEGKMNIKYSRLQALMEDEQYYYLFLDKSSACMIDGKTLRPSSAEKFKEFVTSKTDLDWRRNKGLLSLNLMDILTMLRKPKAKNAGKPKKH